MVGAQRFELRLGRAHFRLDRFQRDGQRRDFHRAFLASAHGVLLFGEPKHVLRQLQPRLELAVL